jgi:hypothetical protein
MLHRSQTGLAAMKLKVSNGRRSLLSGTSSLTPPFTSSFSRWISDSVRVHAVSIDDRELCPHPLTRGGLREHLSGLQKRNIRSANILAVFQQYCYVPKHTVGEQLLHVGEAKRERAAYDSASVTEDVFSPS